MFVVDTERSEIFLYDDIGPAYLGMIDAELVYSGLQQIGSNSRVTVRLNSAGGSVDEGVAIFNLLQRHAGGIDTVVDSLAASMASYLFMAGQNRSVAENSRIMVHEPWTIAVGNAQSLREAAQMLDSYTASIAPQYAKISGRDLAEVEGWMQAETWFTASEAIAQGLATDIADFEATEPAQVAEGRFRNTPEAILRPAAGGSRHNYPIKRERARLLVS